MNKYIFKNVKYIRNFLIVLGILSVIATITGIIIPYFNGVFVDVLIYTQDFNSIIKLTMLIITIGVVDVVFNYIYNLTYIKVLNKVVYRTKMQLIEHLRRVSYLRLSKLNPVYLNQRINIDVIAVFQFFIENYITCFMMVIVIILEGYMVFRVNVLIGGLVVLFVPVYVVIYLYLKRPLYEKNIYYKEEQNIFFHKINDQFALLKSIKINADFAKNNEAMDNSFRVFLKKTIDFNKVSFLFSSCDSVVSLLFRSIMYIIAGCEIIKKNLTVGEFTMINAYFSLLLTQIRYFFNLGKKYQDAKSSYDRIEELLHIPKESNGNQVVDQINEITLDDISFRYVQVFSMAPFWIIRGYNMKTDFMIETKSEQILGEMKLEVKRENNIVRVYIEQFLYNNTRMKELLMDEDGNVLKYSLVISDWMNNREEFFFEYIEKEEAYYDSKEDAYLRIGKQKVFESFYSCPKLFFKEEKGQVKIFDFTQSMYTALIYKSWFALEENCIQIIAPACVKMVFNQYMELVRYEDINTRIQYV